MAFLNNEWFVNNVRMHGDRKKGEICIETGYEKELQFAQHCPPNGVYWLYLNNYTSAQTAKFGPRGSWMLVETRGDVGPLRRLNCLFGGRLEIDWYDFTNAHWRGPIELPKEPEDRPKTAADRR